MMWFRNVMTAIRNTYTTSSQFYKMMLNLTEEEEMIKQNLKKKHSGVMMRYRNQDTGSGMW
jgi:hypothetical protein